MTLTQTEQMSKKNSSCNVLSCSNQSSTVLGFDEYMHVQVAVVATGVTVAVATGEEAAVATGVAMEVTAEMIEARVLLSLFFPVSKGFGMAYSTRLRQQTDIRQNQYYYSIDGICCIGAQKGAVLKLKSDSTQAYPVVSFPGVECARMCRWPRWLRGWRP